MITAVTELSVSVSVENCEGGSRTVVRLVGDADVTTPALAEILATETAKKPHLLLGGHLRTHVHRLRRPP